MLRNLLVPIVSGLLVGKAVSLYRDKRFERHHPVKSLFGIRRA